MLDEEVTEPEAAEEPNPQEETEDKSVEEQMEEAKAADANEEGENEEEAQEETKEAKEHEQHKPKKSADERIGEITKKFRTEEREKAALKEKVRDLERQIKGVTDERSQEKQEEADAQIDKLWVDHETALTELDGKTASRILRKITELERKKVVPVAMVPKDDEIDKKVSEREISRAAEKFRKRNTWFNKDSEDYSAKMRRYAISAELELVEARYDGSYDELLAEVEKDVNETFSKSKRPSGLPTVAGVNPNKRITTNKVINLTDEQKEVAYGVFSGGTKAQAEAKYMGILKEQGGTR